jgi:hypothetical protein
LELIPVVPGPPGAIEFPMVPLVNVPPLCPFVLPLVTPGVTPVEVGEPPEGGAVVEPAVPVCANAKVLDRLSADASAIVASFMTASCFGFATIPIRSRWFRSRSATHP